MSQVPRDLQIAMVNAIEGDAPLAALLAGDKVYSGVVPEGSPLDYLQLGTSGESPGAHAFGMPGSTGEEEVHIWTADVSKMSALAIYRELSRVLARLPLPAHTMLVGRCELVTVLADPSRTAMHGVVRYRWRVRLS